MCVLMYVGGCGFFFYMHWGELQIRQTPSLLNEDTSWDGGRGGSYLQMFMNVCELK